jgi:hypothetical protein
MTTWTIVEHSSPDRLTVRYTADDGVRSVLMPDMFWDQVTPLEEWLGRVDPWPTPPPAARVIAAPLVGMTGACTPMERTVPYTPEELAARVRETALPQYDPLTVPLDPNYKPEF